LYIKRGCHEQVEQAEQAQVKKRIEK